MTNKNNEALKPGLDNEFEANAGNNPEDVAGESSTGAVLPDPEEIKLPFLKSETEQRTVIDVNTPKDSTADDGTTDPPPFDYRRNK